MIACQSAIIVDRLWVSTNMVEEGLGPGHFGGNPYSTAQRHGNPLFSTRGGIQGPRGIVYDD